MVCDWGEGWEEAFRAGALGSIMLDSETMQEFTNFALPIPTSGLTAEKHDVVKSYMNSTK